MKHVAERPIRRRTVRVGAAADRAEAEADRLAEQALSLAAGFREPGLEPGVGDDISASDAVHRSTDDALAGELDLDAAALTQASGSPARLDAKTRRRMESGFGRDLGAVRIHTGQRAAALAADMGARAFTLGHDVYFGAGQYRPGSGDGDHVLAHELAHTVQAGAAVHRFPDTWHTAPVPWGQQTASVRRPGGGVSGGVYILTSKSGRQFGPVKTAVVKPTFGQNAAGQEESAAQIVGADRLMREFGLTAPTSRAVAKSAPEFQDLLALCLPKQPPQPAAGQPGHDNWQPLTAAQDMVIMSEIVDAKTFSQLAVEAAGGSRDGQRDLISMINNQDVMYDFGLMMVADMVIGNNDRFLSETKNLGNVMASVVNGRRTLTAFDTTAVLPALKTGKEFLKNAKVSPGVSLKFLTTNPESVLDEMLGALVEAVKQNETPPQPGQTGPTFGERLETAISGSRTILVGWFMQGWNAGVAKALQLSQGTRAKDVLGDTAGKGNVDLETLKGTLTYVGSGGDPSRGAKAAALQFPRFVDSIDLRPITPDGGVVDPTMWQKLPSDAVKAEWVDNPKLPTIADLDAVSPAVGTVDPNKYLNVKTQLMQARTAANTALTDKVRRGKSKPRNRTLLGQAVVGAEAITAGTFWLSASTAKLKSIAQDLAESSGIAAQLTKADATTIANKVGTIEGLIDSTELTRAAYDRGLIEARKVIPKTEFPDKMPLAQSLDTALARSSQAAVQIPKIKALKLDDVITAMRAQAAKPQTPSPQLPPAKTGQNST